jgi:hypothetical protein
VFLDVWIIEVDLGWDLAKQPVKHLVRQGLATLRISSTVAALLPLQNTVCQSYEFE